MYWLVPYALEGIGDPHSEFQPTSDPIAYNEIYQHKPGRICVKYFNFPKSLVVIIYLFGFE